MTQSIFKFAQAEDSPGFLLWQTTIIWQRQIKQALEQYDISHAQFVIMATLLWLTANKHDVNQVVLVNWTKLDKMTVSKALKNLVAAKLVHRTQHEIDTRAKAVVLTNKGTNLIHKLVPIVEQLDEQFFGKLAAKDQSALQLILAKLIDTSL